MLVSHSFLDEKVWSQWYGLNIWTPKSIWENLVTSVVVARAENFRRWWGHENIALTVKIAIIMKEPCRVFSSSTSGDTITRRHPWIRKSDLIRHGIYQHLDLELLSLWDHEGWISIAYKPHNVGYSVIEDWMNQDRNEMRPAHHLAGGWQSQDLNPCLFTPKHSYKTSTLYPKLLIAVRPRNYSLVSVVLRQFLQRLSSP